MQRTKRRMRILCLLAGGSMLFQVGGCNLRDFMQQRVGFAEALGAYAAGYVVLQLLSGDGPGPICIGPGCVPTGNE